MFKNPIVKNILSALAVAGFGFVLLGLIFLFDFLFQSLIVGFIKLFISVSVNPEMDYHWLPPMMQVLFMVVICLISWFIFRSKLGVLYKAIFLTVPTAVAIVTIGIFFYHWPLAVYSIGGVISIGVLYYFYRSKQPWLYYYTVILVGLTLAIFSLLGGEI